MTTNALKLKDPNELLAVIPYLLGFHPTRSLVLVCLSNNRIGLTQRLDLPQDAHDVASALLPSLITENPDAVILVGYETQAGESLPALEALTTAPDVEQPVRSGSTRVRWTGRTSSRAAVPA